MTEWTLLTTGYGTSEGWELAKPVWLVVLTNNQKPLNRQTVSCNCVFWISWTPFFEDQERFSRPFKYPHFLPNFQRSVLNVEGTNRVAPPPNLPTDFRTTVYPNIFGRAPRESFALLVLCPNLDFLRFWVVLTPRKHLFSRRINPLSDSSCLCLNLEVSLRIALTPKQPWFVHQCNSSRVASSCSPILVGRVRASCTFLARLLLLSSSYHLPFFSLLLARLDAFRDAKIAQINPWN